MRWGWRTSCGPGWFRQAHIKTESYRLRLLLTQRCQLKRKALDFENTIRHSLKAFGVRHQGHRTHRLRRGGARGGGRRCADLRADGCMLTARAMLWKQYRRLHDLVVKFVARHELFRRFMAIPAVGPVTPLSS
jgi:transposase